MPNKRRDQDGRPHLELSRVVREGGIAGTAGGAATAFAYLVFDWGTGQPMRSADVIAALAGNPSDIASGGWSALEVVVLLGAHWAFWVVVALIVAFWMSYADLHPKSWSVVFGVIFVTLMSGLYITGELSRPESGGVPLWAGTLLGAGVMGRILMRGHTGIFAHFEQISLTPNTQRDLDLSYQHERRSLARYRAAAKRHPGDDTLGELLEISKDRASSVEALFENYRCELPEASVTGEPSVPDGLDEIYRDSIRDEEEKVSMYGRFLLSVDEERAHQTFSHLHWNASGRCLRVLRDRLANDHGR